ncbi:hypothetical protein [Streptomyces sp. DH12]|uniref:hypothetical protein n=1 Tax=Streptomyces sp. DH12 TaxID=2857010 RepID=UPI001E40FA79|nr:hypothetical protein [Streptomyces sp. DH12]
MPRYRCALCATTSRPYLTRWGAEQHGRGHRTDRHGGDHPDGEHILYGSATGPQQAGDWSPLLVVLVLLGLALLVKLA